MACACNSQRQQRQPLTTADDDDAFDNYMSNNTNASAAGATVWDASLSKSIAAKQKLEQPTRDACQGYASDTPPESPRESTQLSSAGGAAGLRCGSAIPGMRPKRYAKLDGAEVECQSGKPRGVLAAAVSSMKKPSRQCASDDVQVSVELGLNGKSEKTQRDEVVQRHHQHSETNDFHRRTAPDNPSHSFDGLCHVAGLLRCAKLCGIVLFAAGMFSMVVAILLFRTSSSAHQPGLDVQVNVQTQDPFPSPLSRVASTPAPASSSSSLGALHSPSSLPPLLSSLSPPIASPVPVWPPPVSSAAPPPIPHSPTLLPAVPPSPRPSMPPPSPVPLSPPSPAVPAPPAGPAPTAPSPPPDQAALSAKYLNTAKCHAYFNDTSSRFHQLWGRMGWVVRNDWDEGCWGGNGSAFFDGALNGDTCSRNWYEGNPGTLGRIDGGPSKDWVEPHFEREAPALLGFDEDIDGHCGARGGWDHAPACVRSNYHILSLYWPVQYNLCRNFEWQLCAIQGMLPMQRERVIRFAFAPKNLEDASGWRPIGSCTGYHPKGCKNYGYPSSDIFYMEACIFATICSNGDEIFGLDEMEDWQCNLNREGYERLVGWLLRF